MQPGDIIVVQLSSGPRLARFIDWKSNRLSVAIGRNREARLPHSRLILETGLSAPGYDAVEDLSRKAETVADEVDLEELWDVVCDDAQPLTLTDIGELYWGVEPSQMQTVGLLLNLFRDELHFVRDGEHYLPVNRETVSRTIERRERRARQTADAQSLSASIRERRLPDSLTDHQSELLDHIRGFVLHGDDYTRATQAKRFLETAGLKGRDLQRGAFQTLVSLGLMDPDENLALEREDIPVDFPEEVLSEAEAVRSVEITVNSDRDDLTHLRVFTIDDADTRDRDDALSIERISDDAWRVGIHVTDAGELIAPDSELNAEADRRMSSVYLPEHTIPMLPTAVSTGRGSLNPGERRAALTVIVDLTGDGEVLCWKVARSFVQSQEALSYEKADSSLSCPTHPLHSGLGALHHIATALRKRREQRGALNLDRDEMSVRVDGDGGICVRVVPRTAPARSLVQEYMVLCNSLLARYCAENELPAPFRSQVTPDVSDIRAQVPDGPLRWYMMTRRLSPASVGTKPGTHGGLGVEAYIQASSPLRRYADLVVQRQILYHLRTGETLFDEEAMTSVAHRADVQGRQLSRIENQRRQHFFLKWLDQRRHEIENSGKRAVYDAIALENPDRRTALLELADWPFRTRAAIPSSVSPGESVRLHLHGVDLWRRTAQFTMEASEAVS